MLFNKVIGENASFIFTLNLNEPFSQPHIFVISNACQTRFYITGQSSAEGTLEKAYYMPDTEFRNYNFSSMSKIEQKPVWA